ncbi:MAG TPA: hypothetical protein VM142_13170 [Acidimicrobiales bacterium]|nr:hypothetical protein [Acidimicrobiales bacterium]
MSAAIVGEALWLVTQLGLGGRIRALSLGPLKPLPRARLGRELP